MHFQGTVTQKTSLLALTGRAVLRDVTSGVTVLKWHTNFGPTVYSGCLLHLGGGNGKKDHSPDHQEQQQGPGQPRGREDGLDEETLLPIPFPDPRTSCHTPNPPSLSPTRLVPANWHISKPHKTVWYPSVTKFTSDLWLVNSLLFTSIVNKINHCRCMASSILTSDQHHIGSTNFNTLSCYLQ